MSAIRSRAKGRRQQGPRQLPHSLRSEILERLRRMVRDQFASVRRFGAAVGVGTGTTSRWFGREAALPDAPALYRILTQTRISLDWLMTGEGPEMHDLSVPLRDLDKSLRERLITALTQIGVPRDDASVFTPRGSQILDQLVERHVNDWKRQNEWRKALDRAKRRRPPSIAALLEQELEKDVPTRPIDNKPTNRQ